MIPKQVSDVLEEFGADWELDGFHTRHPSTPDCHIAVFDEQDIDGSDFQCAIVSHGISLDLYDRGGKAAKTRRDELQRLLMEANIKHVRHQSAYIYDTKMYMTVFDLDTVIEKGSINGN